MALHYAKPICNHGGWYTWCPLRDKKALEQVVIFLYYVGNWCWKLKWKNTVSKSLRSAEVGGSIAWNKHWLKAANKLNCITCSMYILEDMILLVSYCFSACFLVYALGSVHLHCNVQEFIPSNSQTTREIYIPNIFLINRKMFDLNH